MSKYGRCLRGLSGIALTCLVAAILTIVGWMAFLAPFIMVGVIVIYIIAASVYYANLEDEDKK